MSISFSKSVVHVPFNVYAEDFNVVQGADFSSKLDKTFNNSQASGQGRFNITFSQDFDFDHVFFSLARVHYRMSSIYEYLRELHG